MPQPMPSSSHESSAFGTLSIRVQPADAGIWIDGERWHLPDGATALIVEVGTGPHHVEIRKDGYKPFSTEVQVRGGATAPLNISLPPLEQ